MARTAEARCVAVTLVGPSRPLVSDQACQPSRKTGTAQRGTSRRVELIRCPEPLSQMRYTVKALELTIPQSLLLRADEVIE